MTITLKVRDGDMYIIPFSPGWTRFGAIRFALNLVNVSKSQLELFKIEE